MNHVMTTAQQDLRSQQLAETRRRISRAVVEVIARDGLSPLTFPAVAEQAGVSLRTVYRHFPNKDALVEAATHHGTEDIAAQFPLEARSLQNVHEFLPLLWEQLLSDRELLEIQTLTTKGQELRVERLRRRQTECIAAIRAEGIDLDDDEMEALGGLMSVLLSSSVSLDLVDRLGIDVDRAAAVTSVALHALARHARTEGAIR
jgi:AcrR family transcriptional regulator